jgi:hypothetical protein
MTWLKIVDQNVQLKMGAPQLQYSSDSQPLSQMRCISPAQKMPSI